MLKKVELYGFSPTGGTKKVGEAFAHALAEEVKYTDLIDRDVEQLSAEEDTIVVAVPVFGGRIPSVAREKLKTLNGEGKKAIALAVYGVRAYEDALLETVELLTDCGFTVVGAGAFNAQHSMVPAVGAGRPDEQDIAEIQAFAAKVAAKLEAGDVEAVTVPGNHPYKDEMTVASAPVCTEDCVVCGACVDRCPTSAMSVVDGKVETQLEKCILCLACMGICPAKARKLAPAHQAGINERLGSLVDVRRENEVFV